MKQKLRVFLTLLLCAVASVGWGEETTIYNTGFESTEGFANLSNYQGTQTTGPGNTGLTWTTYYGCVSTTNPLSGSQSVQCRYYGSANLVEPYSCMNFDLENVLSISFKSKVNNTNLSLLLQYSNDSGKTWVDVQSFTLKTSVDNYSYRFETVLPKARFRFLVKHNTSITSGSQQFYLDDVAITGETGGSTTETCATPTFSPAAGDVEAGTEVTISSATDGATIYYTTDGSDPTTSSTRTQGTSVIINEACTVKAIAVKEDYNNSAVATATYSILQVVNGYTVDFESDLASYVDWTFTNIGRHTETITAHSGSYYGANVNSSNNAVTSAVIQTKEKVANPTTLTCYISKESKNTTESNWIVEVSYDGTTWSQVTTMSATEMSKGNWNQFTANLGEYNNVYVRVRYEGSNAVRAIDDISIIEGGKMTATVTIDKTSLNISETATVTTDGPAVTLSTSDATVASINGTTVTAVGAGTATITATWEENDTFVGGTKEFTITVTDPNAPGSINNPYTVAQARAAIDTNTGITNVYATGIVSAIVDEYSAQYKNITFDISSDGKTSSDQLRAYRCKKGTGTDDPDVNDIQVGDVVVLYGNLTNYEGTYEFTTGNVLVSIEREKIDPTIVVNETETIVYGNTFIVDDSMIEGGKITVTSSNTSVATVSGLVITPQAVGETTITVATAESDRYNAGSETFTLTVTQPEGQNTAPTGSSAFSLTTIFNDKDLGYDEGMDWESSIDATAFETANDARGVQFGTAKGEFTLSSSINQTVTKVSVVLSTNGADNTIAVKVGGNDFTSTYGGLEEPATTISLESGIKNETIEFTGTGTGSIVISIDDKLKSIWIKSITVSSEGSEAPAITVTLNGNGYATFCSQYPLNFDGNDDVTAWILTGFGNDDDVYKMNYSKITAVKGGVGMLLKGEANATVEIESVDCSEVPTPNLFVGTLAPTFVGAGEVYGLKGDTFKKSQAGIVKPYKAFISAENIPNLDEAKSFVFVFEDEATGVRTIETVSAEDAKAIFNLSGQRVNRAQKGIYIVNGKKILVK